MTVYNRKFGVQCQLVNFWVARHALATLNRSENVTIYLWAHIKSFSFSRWNTIYLHLDILLVMPWSLSVASTNLWSAAKNSRLFKTLQFWRILQQVPMRMWSSPLLPLQHYYTVTGDAATLWWHDPAIITLLDFVKYRMRVLLMFQVPQL